MPYTIILNFRGPADADGLDVANEVGDRLLAGVGSGQPGMAVVTYSSDAGDLRAATGDALEVPIPSGWTLDGLEVLVDDLFNAELERPIIPDLVGVNEIAEMISQSPHDVAELTLHPRFPEPVVRLAAGPVYTSIAVQAFLDTVDPQREATTRIGEI